MSTTQPSTDPTQTTCAVDRSCGPDTGCGCGPTSSRSSRGYRAAVVAALCALGCLALPVAIGGFAALGGALTGEGWVVAVGLVVAAVAAVIVKRSGGGSVC